MRFASSITAAATTTAAIDELLEPIEHRMTPGMVDLALLFVTSHFFHDLDEIVERVSAAFPGAVLLGCGAEGTIGCDRECERIPSMSLLAASLPDVTVRPFRVLEANLESLESVPDWERLVGVSPESEPAFVALADPFRFNVQGFVTSLNEAYPGAPLVGGIASAGAMPQKNRLLLNGEIHDEGMVGVALSGRLAIETVVSQGCRPIGHPLVVTKAQRNIIVQLGAKPALKQLRDIFMELSEEDERLAKQSLFVGRVIDEYKDRFARGDFLIHNIIGVDRRTGAIAIAGQARVGATVQFHVRDAASADEDLRAMLSPFRAAHVRGAMLFGCNGRGTQMWPQPGHDVGVLRELLTDVPVAGFFCGGEFGPVGGKNFVHGFTASIALFHERREGPPGPPT